MKESGRVQVGSRPGRRVNVHVSSALSVPFPGSSRPICYRNLPPFRRFQSSLRLCADLDEAPPCLAVNQGPKVSRTHHTGQVCPSYFSEPQRDIPRLFRATPRQQAHVSVPATRVCTFCSLEHHRNLPSTWQGDERGLLAAQCLRLTSRPSNVNHSFCMAAVHGLLADKPALVTGNYRLLWVSDSRPFSSHIADTPRGPITTRKLERMKDGTVRRKIPSTAVAVLRFAAGDHARTRGTLAVSTDGGGVSLETTDSRSSSTQGLIDTDAVWAPHHAASTRWLGVQNQHRPSMPVGVAESLFRQEPMSHQKAGTNITASARRGW
jgi:hypothetical protein